MDSTLLQVVPRRRSPSLGVAIDKPDLAPETNRVLTASKITGSEYHVVSLRESDCVEALTRFITTNTTSGKVISEFHQRQRARECRKFLTTIDTRVPARLDVHLILDNSSTHKTPAIH